MSSSKRRENRTSISTKKSAAMILIRSLSRGKTSRCKTGGCSPAVAQEGRMKSSTLTPNLGVHSLLLKMIKMHIATKIMPMVGTKSL